MGGGDGGHYHWGNETKHIVVGGAALVERVAVALLHLQHRIHLVNKDGHGGIVREQHLKIERLVGANDDADGPLKDGVEGIGEDAVGVGVDSALRALD